MPRRNAGPRLRYLEKRGTFYIVWTENGRSRERSTGTSVSGEAQIALAEFIRERTRGVGPREPSETLITDILSDYIDEHAGTTVAPWRIGLAVKSLTPFWVGQTVGNVTRNTCQAYA